MSVVCLKEGRHQLPSNVSVYSLGKPSYAPDSAKTTTGKKASKGAGDRLLSRLRYVWNFYRYIWTLRRGYDGVFVHMNQEYVLLGWKIWWLLGKRVVLWRNHKKGSLLTRMAALVSHTVCYTSPEAYVAGYKNAVRMPIGIDTDLFKPSAQAPDPRSILFLGRLDPVKKCEVFIEALEKLHADGVAFSADIVGDPTPGNEQYAHDIRNKASTLALDGVLTMHPGVPHAQTPALYASHAIYVNLTPSGSFDKTIGEAMSSGCNLLVVNTAVASAIPQESIVKDDTNSLKAGMLFYLQKGSDERECMAVESRAYIMEQHSISMLTQGMMRIFA